MQIRGISSCPGAVLASLSFAAAQINHRRLRARRAGCNQICCHGWNTATKVDAEHIFIPIKDMESLFTRLIALRRRCFTPRVNHCEAFQVEESVQRARSRGKPSPTATAFILISLLAAPLLQANAETGTTTQSEAAADKTVRLPGIEIHPVKRIVDVDAQVSLTDGMLELIACTEGTKEHEAIIRINALPIHVHTALLLIGARNGTPAMRQPINEEQTRWRHVRPNGQPIHVSLVVEDAEGKPVERPISDFVKYTEGDPYMPDIYNQRPDSEEERQAFPNVFLFTGSHLIDDRDGNKQYLADQSGHVITISTFGDELLGLADVQSRDNGELVWEVDSTHLPPLDSKVKLRLRPATPEAVAEEAP